MDNKTQVINSIIGLKALRCDLYEKKTEIERQIVQNIKLTKEQVFILERIEKQEAEEKMSRIAQRIDGKDVKLKEEREKVKSKLPVVKDLPAPVEKKPEPPKEPESVKEPDVETEETV